MTDWSNITDVMSNANRVACVATTSSAQQTVHSSDPDENLDDDLVRNGRVTRWKTHADRHIVMQVEPDSAES